MREFGAFFSKRKNYLFASFSVIMFGLALQIAPIANAASSEYDFFNPSPAGDEGGLAIPASCPSDIHSGGDGNPGSWGSGRWGTNCWNNCGVQGQHDCNGNCSVSDVGGLGGACNCGGTYICDPSGTGSVCSTSATDGGPCTKETRDAGGNICNTTSGTWDCSRTVCSAPEPAACGTPPRCGDGSINQASEECDDGDSGNGACPKNCDSSCKNNSCLVTCTNEGNRYCDPAPPRAVPGDYWEWKCGCSGSPGPGWIDNSAIAGPGCYNHQIQASDAANCPASGSPCGNGSCTDPGEDCNTCPVDCGSCPPPPSYPGVSTALAKKAGQPAYPLPTPNAGVTLRARIWGGTYPSYWIFKNPIGSPIIPPAMNSSLYYGSWSWVGGRFTWSPNDPVNGTIIYPTGRDGQRGDQSMDPYSGRPEVYEFPTGALTETTTYRVIAYDSYAAGQGDWLSNPWLSYSDHTVTVAPSIPPSVSCSVNGGANTSIMAGASVTFSWSSTGATSCLPVPLMTSGVPSWDRNGLIILPSGTFAVGPLAQAGSPYTFGVTCSNAIGSAFCSTTVNVTAPNNPPTVAIDLPPVDGSYTSPLDLAGRVISDPEGDPIIDYEWRDGDCATGTLISPLHVEDPGLTSLSAGPHTLYFRAMDNGSHTWSACATRVVTITSSGYTRVCPNTESILVGETKSFVAWHHPTTNITDIALPLFCDNPGSIVGANNVTATATWVPINGPAVGATTGVAGQLRGVTGIPGGGSAAMQFRATYNGAIDTAAVTITQPTLLVCPAGTITLGYNSSTNLSAYYDAAGTQTCAAPSAPPVTESANWLTILNPSIASVNNTAGSKGRVTAGNTTGTARVQTTYNNGFQVLGYTKDISVQCVPTTWNCPPERESNTCSNDTPWSVATDCPGITHTCTGTRSCDFNWKEVAP